MLNKQPEAGGMRKVTSPVTPTLKRRIPMLIEEKGCVFTLVDLNDLSSICNSSIDPG